MDILKYVDHTLLKPQATWEEVKVLLDESAHHGCASACIAPCFVKKAKEESMARITTVIGFPLGYQAKGSKVFEAKQACADGADEIDMVINIASLKAGDYDYIKDEIRAIKEAVGDRVLKVIVETAYLDQDEKIKACQLVEEAGADYIKTSTGFASSGARLEDVELFKKTCPDLKIKAAGGISSLNDAQAFIQAGASRLGSSGLVKMYEDANK